MSLTVKAYLERESEENEIRRFALEQDVCTSHAYLREKITHIFPALKDKSFSLYWKDAENELIAFSSDEEQTEALGLVNDGVFKIYIKEDGNNPEPGEGVFHPHVFCDGCDGPVYGIRYKCTVCPDYDLCSKCKATGLHSEHNMMAISHPFRGGWMGFGCFQPPPPPPPPPHHGHHHGGHHHGFPPHGPPHFQGPHPFGPGGRGPFGPRGRGRCCRAGVRMCHQMMKDFWQATTQAESGEGKEMPADDSQKEAQGNATPTNNANEEYLKTVGEHVAAMLDPLGINVEVDVVHGGVRHTHCGRGPSSTSTTWEGHVHCETCSDSTSTKNSAEEKQDDDAEMDQDQNVNPEEKQECADTAATNKGDEQDTETGEAGTAARADKGECSPDREWTIIDDGSNEADTAKSSLHEASEMDLARDDKAAPSADAEDPIAKALDHMKAMGFSDEGGWLTTLLKATNGDINKALDAIRANRGK